MDYLPIHNFPGEIPLDGQIVIAPANRQDGFLSRAGFHTGKHTPAAASQLRLEGALTNCENGRLVPWLINRSYDGIIRFPLYCTPQLVSTPEIEEAFALYPKGRPFSTGEFFSTGYGFRYTPLLSVSGVAEARTTIMQIDSSNFPRCLQEGHIFGHRRSVYHVKGISYSRTTDVAEVEITPPLRRDIAPGESISLRPTFDGKIDEIDPFVSPFKPGGFNDTGDLTVNEWVGDNLLGP